MLVEPFKSVGGLLLNEKRESIRKKINEAFEAHVNEFGGKKEYFDFFPDSDIIVYYDKNNKAIAFEFFQQNPIFNGINLLMEPYTELVEMFSDIDSDLFIDETSFTSNKYGISARCPYKGKDGLASPESVIIFNHSFYK